MEIHKKPNEFTILDKIFKFKLENKNEFGKGQYEFSIDEKSLKQLLFIEYIVQRINELLTSRTKAYLLEKELKSKPTINEERERNEYIDMCDKYVAKKGAFFSDIDYSGGGAKRSTDINTNADDNGEEEMMQKLKEFENLFKQDKKEKERHEDLNTKDEEYEFGAKKPMPDYEKLKEEAIQQQLKIKEFFMGSASEKRN